MPILMAVQINTKQNRFPILATLNNYKTMKNLRITILTAALCIYAIAINAQSINYSEDFESYVPIEAGGSATIGGGWLTFNAAIAPGGIFLGGGGGPAPNTNNISHITNAAPSASGGAQYLNVFNNYADGNNHIPGINFVETNVFQEAFLAAGDADIKYRFSFEHKLGDLNPADPAAPGFDEVVAFIKVFDPAFNLLAFPTFDTSNDAAWTSSFIDLTIDPVWAQNGYLIQWGFLSRATSFAPTSVAYDNVSFALCPPPPPPVDPAIPTMGEWGIICLSILFMIFGIVAIRERQMAF